MVNNIKVDLENLAIDYDNMFKPDDIVFSKYNAALDAYLSTKAGE